MAWSCTRCWTLIAFIPGSWYMWICWVHLQWEHHPKHTLFSSACTEDDRSSNPSHSGLKLLEPQISKQHQSRISFITPGWHVTRDLNLLSLKMVTWADSNVSLNKYVKIMVKPTICHNYYYTSKCNHWASTQRFWLSMIYSDHLTWNIIISWKPRRI
jgi:hypothetical protein